MTERCLLEKDSIMSFAVGYITVDCVDTQKLATFWSAVLGYDNKGSDEDGAEIVPADGTQVPMLFQLHSAEQVLSGRDSR